MQIPVLISTVNSGIIISEVKRTAAPIKKGKVNKMKNATYKEERYMDRDDLRNLCIKNNWYTRGNSDEYENLLHTCGGNKKIITTDDILNICLLDPFNGDD